MNDLSHWDFAESFSVHESAALIVGVEPNSVYETDRRVLIVRGRLQRDYEQALKQAVREYEPCFDDRLKQQVKAKRTANMLVSLLLEHRWRDAVEGLDGAADRLLSDEFMRQFHVQRFSREEISRWIKTTGLPSKYPFDRTTDESSIREVSNEIDPEDLPTELDIARIAFTAVQNETGHPEATFKNRLRKYLRKHYPGLQESVIERIATVANPDKERGRKTFDD